MHDPTIGIRAGSLFAKMAQPNALSNATLNPENSTPKVLPRLISNNPFGERQHIRYNYFIINSNPFCKSY